MISQNPKKKIEVCIKIVYFENTYRVIINDCPIAVENSHKFWMCRQPRNVRQTSRQISTTAGSATYRRY
jgi:hypothetical protein